MITWGRRKICLLVEKLGGKVGRKGEWRVMPLSTVQHVLTHSLGFPPLKCIETWDRTTHSSLSIMGGIFSLRRRRRGNLNFCGEMRCVPRRGWLSRHPLGGKKESPTFNIAKVRWLNFWPLARKINLIPRPRDPLPTENGQKIILSHKHAFAAQKMRKVKKGKIYILL